jgi:hypothetical protein
MQLYRYFVSQSSEFCRHNALCCFSTSVYCCLFRCDSVRELLDTLSYMESCCALKLRMCVNVWVCAGVYMHKLFSYYNSNFGMHLISRTAYMKTCCWHDAESSIHLPSYQYIPRRLILMLSFLLPLGLPVVHLPRGFRTKILDIFHVFSVLAVCSANFQFI